MTKWPKIIHNLSAEQKQVSDDWMKYWLQKLPNDYSGLVRFNHQYVIDTRPYDFLTVLDIGCGLGEHIAYENLTAKQTKNYYAIDLRENLLIEVKKKYPNINAELVDCQKNMPYCDNFFDRVLAIHVLEHLPDLPSTLREVYRTIKKGGVFQVVLPCEGGMAYSLGRELTSKREFERRYKISYDSYIKTEHVNTYDEVVFELKKYFTFYSKKYYPFVVGGSHLNLVAGFCLKPKELIHADNVL